MWWCKRRPVSFLGSGPGGQGGSRGCVATLLEEWGGGRKRTISSKARSGAAESRARRCCRVAGRREPGPARCALASLTAQAGPSLASPLSTTSPLSWAAWRGSATQGFLSRYSPSLVAHAVFSLVSSPYRLDFTPRRVLLRNVTWCSKLGSDFIRNVLLNRTFGFEHLNRATRMRYFSRTFGPKQTPPSLILKIRIIWFTCNFNSRSTCWIFL